MFEKALNYVLTYPKTERQVRQWLHGKKCESEEAEVIIEKLKEYGYIDDASFAKLFVEQQSSRQGRGAILTKMYQKGLSREIIESNTAEIDEAIQRDLAMRIAEKYGFEDKRKLFGHLLRKGFDIDLVRDIVRHEDWD